MSLKGKFKIYRTENNELQGAAIGVLYLDGNLKHIQKQLIDKRYYHGKVGDLSFDKVSNHGYAVVINNSYHRMIYFLFEDLSDDSGILN